MYLYFFVYCFLCIPTNLSLCFVVYFQFVMMFLAWLQYIISKSRTIIITCFIFICFDLYNYLQPILLNLLFSTNLNSNLSQIFFSQFKKGLFKLISSYGTTHQDKLNKLQMWLMLVEAFYVIVYICCNNKIEHRIVLHKFSCDTFILFLNM